MNEREAQDKIRRGQHAERLLKDPLMVEVIDGMKRTVFHNIETSNYKDIDEREDLYKMLQAINAFEKDLKQRIQGGVKAKSVLEKLFSKGE